MQAGSGGGTRDLNQGMDRIPVQIWPVDPQAPPEAQDIAVAVDVASRTEPRVPVEHMVVALTNSGDENGGGCKNGQGKVMAGGTIQIVEGGAESLQKIASKFAPPEHDALACVAGIEVKGEQEWLNVISTWMEQRSSRWDTHVTSTVVEWARKAGNRNMEPIKRRAAADSVLQYLQCGTQPPCRASPPWADLLQSFTPCLRPVKGHPAITPFSAVAAHIVLRALQALEDIDGDDSVGWDHGLAKSLVRNVLSIYRHSNTRLLRALGTVFVALLDTITRSARLFAVLQQEQWMHPLSVSLRFCNSTETVMSILQTIEKCASEHHGHFRGDALVRSLVAGLRLVTGIQQDGSSRRQISASDQRIVLLIIDQLARFDTLGREVAQMLTRRLIDLSLLAIQHTSRRAGNWDNVILRATALVGTAFKHLTSHEALGCSDAIAMLRYCCATGTSARIRNNIFVAVCRFVSLQPALGPEVLRGYPGICQLLSMQFCSAQSKHNAGKNGGGGGDDDDDDAAALSSLACLTALLQKADPLFVGRFLICAEGRQLATTLAALAEDSSNLESKVQILHAAAISNLCDVCYCPPAKNTQDPDAASGVHPKEEADDRAGRRQPQNSSEECEDSKAASDAAIMAAWRNVRSTLFSALQNHAAHAPLRSLICKHAFTGIWQLYKQPSNVALLAKSGLLNRVASLLSQFVGRMGSIALHGLNAGALSSPIRSPVGEAKGRVRINRALRRLGSARAILAMLWGSLLQNKGRTKLRSALWELNFDKLITDVLALPDELCGGQLILRPCKHSCLALWWTWAVCESITLRSLQSQQQNEMEKGDFDLAEGTQKQADELRKRMRRLLNSAVLDAAMHISGRGNYSTSTRSLVAGLLEHLHTRVRVQLKITDEKGISLHRLVSCCRNLIEVGNEPQLLIAGCRLFVSSCHSIRSRLDFATDKVLAKVTRAFESVLHKSQRITDGVLDDGAASDPLADHDANNDAGFVIGQCIVHVSEAEAVRKILCAEGQGSFLRNLIIGARRPTTKHDIQQICRDVLRNLAANSQTWSHFYHIELDMRKRSIFGAGLGFDTDETLPNAATASCSSVSTGADTNTATAGAQQKLTNKFEAWLDTLGAPPAEFEAGIERSKRLAAMLSKTSRRRRGKRPKQLRASLSSGGSSLPQIHETARHRRGQFKRELLKPLRHLWIEGEDKGNSKGASLPVAMNSSICRDWAPELTSARASDENQVLRLKIGPLQFKFSSSTQSMEAARAELATTSAVADVSRGQMLLRRKQAMRLKKGLAPLPELAPTVADVPAALVDIDPRISVSEDVDKKDPENKLLTFAHVRGSRVFDGTFQSYRLPGKRRAYLSLLDSVSHSHPLAWEASHPLPSDFESAQLPQPQRVDEIAKCTGVIQSTPLLVCRSGPSMPQVPQAPQLSSAVAVPQLALRVNVVMKRWSKARRKREQVRKRRQEAKLTSRTRKKG